MHDWIRSLFSIPRPIARLASRSFVITCANCAEEIGILTVSGDPLVESVVGSGEWSAAHIYRCPTCLTAKLGTRFSREVAPLA